MDTHTLRQLLDAFLNASRTMRLRRSIDAQVNRRLISQTRGTTCSAKNLTTLRDGQIWSCEAVARQVDLRVVSGNVWITQSGSAADVVLGAGQHFSGERCGKIVVQALGDSVIEIAKASAMWAIS